MKKLFLCIAIFLSLFLLNITYIFADDCNQRIEIERPQTQYQYSRRVYPIIVSPNGQECGSDCNDFVLQFNIPEPINYGSWTVFDDFSTPGNFRLYSDNSSLSFLIWSGTIGKGLSANGLCSNTVRVCVGNSRFGSLRRYFTSVYLWSK